jgi:hypothetical protein
MDNKIKVILTVLVLIVLGGAGFYLFQKYNKAPTVSTNSKTQEQKMNQEEPVKIDISNIKVEQPKPQSSNLDTNQIDQEINKLDLSDDSEMNVDQVQ